MNTQSDKINKQLTVYFDGSEFRLEPIVYGASVRRYYRLQFKKADHFPDKNIILMQIPLNRLEIAKDYSEISSYLTRHRISNPRIFRFDGERGWIFMEEASGVILVHFLNKNPNIGKDKIYQDLLEFVITLQQRTAPDASCAAFHRRFDRKKFQYEFNFHVKEQLLEKYFDYRMSPDNQIQFQRFSQEISSFLDVEPSVFVHRDFQSSNIFYDPSKKGSHFQIIDFQDARLGHPLYDMVSLLWDSYVDLGEDLINQLIQYLYGNYPLIRHHFTENEYERHIDYLVIQRKLHDAGAFAYTFFLTKNNYYIKYIRRAIFMALSKIRKYSEWAEIARMFQKIVSEENV